MFKLRMLFATLFVPAALLLMQPATAQQKTTIGVSLAQLAQWQARFAHAA